jgi:hypothetical protein
MKDAAAILFALAAFAYVFAQVLLVVTHSLFVALSSHPH